MKYPLDILLALLTPMLLILPCGVNAASREANPEQPLEQRFLTEAPGQWDAYNTIVPRLQGNSKSTRVDLNANSAVIEQRSMVLKRSNSAMLMIEEDNTRDGRCYAKNDRYAFELRRKPNQDAWALVRIETNLADRAGKTGIAFFDKWSPVTAIIESPFVLAYVAHLPKIAKKPGFHIERATTDIREGIQLIRIDFRFTPDEEDIKARKLCAESGWIVLNPNQYWRVCECELHVVGGAGDKAKVHEIVECKLSKSGYPIVERRTTHMVAPNVSHQKITEAAIEERECSPEEFTLSAFGLPEPIGFEKKATPLYLWFGLGGVILLVLAVGFRGYVMRKKRTSS